MTAKTQRLKHAFGNPDYVLEVNCANASEPNLRAYERAKHKAILYDEASCNMVLNQKNMFQSPNALVSLGQSATSCYAYDVYVWQTGQFIASNTWLEELENLTSDAGRNWLIANSIVVNVGSQKQYLD